MITWVVPYGTVETRNLNFYDRGDLFIEFSLQVLEVLHTCSGNLSKPNALPYFSKIATLIHISISCISVNENVLENCVFTVC